MCAARAATTAWATSSRSRCAWWAAAARGAASALGPRSAAAARFPPTQNRCSSAAVCALSTALFSSPLRFLRPSPLGHILQSTYI
jgi:hypothetical protein